MNNRSYPAWPQGKKIFTNIYEVVEDDVSQGMYIDGVSYEKSLSCQNSVYKTGQTYDFYMINLTPDSHPMHFHLINFQKVFAVPFDVDAYIQAWFDQTGQKMPRGGFENTPQILDPTPYFIGPPEYP